MHLLFLSFGNKLSSHVQANFALYSFLRQQRHYDSVSVMTDAPEWYNQLSNHINVLTIDAATIKDWKGPRDYPYRAKIKAVQQLARRFPGDPIVFTDTDTILHGDIGFLKKELQSGKAFMHEDEGPLITHTLKKAKPIWQTIRGKEIGGLTMKETDHMWNSGVIATPNTQDGKELDMALAICDGILELGMYNHTMEQYGLGLALTHYYNTVHAAKPMIAHYWGNKEEWNEFIMAWLAEHHCKRTSYEGMLAAYGNLNLHAVPILKRTPNTATKLHNWVDKQFAPREVTYMPKK
jgi:hypothetical protein